MLFVYVAGIKLNIAFLKCIVFIRRRYFFTIKTPLFMKQFKFTVLFVSMLCILIGYFEPANAAVINKSMTKMLTSSGDAYAILNTTSSACPFYPNPISPDQSIMTASDASDPIANTYVTYIGGGEAGTIENLQYFPQTIETLQYLPLEINKNFPDGTTVIGTRYIFSTLPVGNYVLTVTTKSGVTYNSKFTVAS